LRGLFIGGCDRSGTTMLGSMLGAGNKIIVTPESQFVWNAIGNISLKPEISTAEIFDEISRNWRFKVWATDISGINVSNIEVEKKYSYCIEEIIKCYSRNHGVDEPEIWIDHAPDNIGHIGFLTELLDDAKFVHIIRDGRGVASSFKNLNWGPNSIVDSAIWWRSKVALGLAASKMYPEDKVITVKYENILHNPKEELMKICDFSNIEFNEVMLKGGRFNTPEYTKSQHDLVGKGVLSWKSESWRDVLTEREIEIFEYKTSELLSYLEYELLYGVKAKAPTKIENMKYRLTGIRNVTNYLKQKCRKYTKLTEQ